MRSLFRQLLRAAYPSSRRGTVRVPRRRTRLQVRPLEDRLVPAVINVNTLVDNLNPGPGLVSLRSAVQQANTDGDATNTINLALPGTYKITLAGTQGETDNQAGEFAILPSAGNLTIQNTSGGTVVVDGNHLNRVFDINPGNTDNPATKTLVTFQGFTIQNGDAFDPNNTDGPTSSGGGIRDQGNTSLTLNNMVLTNNVASADGGGVSMENAPASTPWTLTLNNTVVSYNHAGDAGGGVETDGKGHVVINGGALTGNTCVNQGAAVWLDATADGVGSVTLTFLGLVYSSPPAVTFSAPQNAGGTTATGTASLLGPLVVAVNITDPGSGYTAAPTVTFSGGGAANQATGTANLTFNNSASLTITGTLIDHNTALNGPTGAVGNAGNGAVTINDCTVEDNYSGSTGGGFGDQNNLGTLTVTNSVFLDNRALGDGGGIQEGGPSTTITNSTIQGNSSGPNGGGVSVEGGNLTILNSTILNNRATVDGGGLFSNASTTTITDAVIQGNSCNLDAGGIFAGGVVLTILDATVADNTASGNGGGIVVETTGTGPAFSTITNTTITGNSALNAGNGNNRGGGIDYAMAAAGNALNLINDTITGNYAAVGGGVRWDGISTLVLGSTVVAGNFGNTQGTDLFSDTGAVVDFGGNFIGNATGVSGFSGVNDQLGTAAAPLDPLLGALQNNGGPSVGAPGTTVPLETEALLPGSKAIGGGVKSFLSPLSDERGFLRTSSVNTDGVDVGAYQTRIVGSQSLSTVPGNGDVNPYGVAFVPANFPTGGVLQPGDLLVANFNNAGNTQGTGTTITRITPTGQRSTFFTSALPGLDNALGILSAGYVVVGNVPNVGGTPQAGALQFLDRNGNVVLTLTDPTLLDGPWSLVVANDTGSTATLYVSNVLNGTVSRFNLQIAGGVITVVGKTQVAAGYGFRLDPAAFVVGPAGLAYDAAHDILYVASSADNQIFKISGASTISNGTTTGTSFVNDQVHLHGPLGLLLLPNGNLLTANSDAQNADPNQPSELVEYNPNGTFINQLSVDPANGGAFGIGVNLANGGFQLAAVDDNTNTITVWSDLPNRPLPDLTLVHTSDPYQDVINVPNPTNAPLTYSATVLTALAEVDKKLGLVFTGNYFQSFAGINGMWLRSTNGGNAAHGGWYFLLPDGTLHQWDGGMTSATATTSLVVATFSPAVYANPLLLAGAAGATAAYKEEQLIDLVFTGNFYQGFAGINGEWLKSANGGNAAQGGWYFLLPDGTLHQWDGNTTSATATTSPTVATLNSTYYQVPSLLYSATPPPAPPAGVTAAFLGDSNVLQLSGYKNLAGNFGVEVNVSNGTTTTTQDFLVNVTEQAPTLAPVATQVVSHTGSLTVTLAGSDADANATLTYSARVFSDTVQTLAYALEQQLALTFTGNYFQSFAGINGMWLRSANGSNAAHGGWYFLLSDGTLHAWDGGMSSATATTSPTVAALNPTYWANPMLLLNAMPTPAPDGVTVTVSGNAVTFGGFGNFTGTLFVIASVTDGIQTASTPFRISVM
jgi:hypothetical protein